MKKLFLPLVLSSVTSCAQMHKSYVAKPGNFFINGKTAGLVISGEYDNSFSDTYFGLVHLVFENKSDEWVTIKDIEVSFGKEANKYVNFLSPKTGKNLLKIYMESKKKVLLMEQKNRAAWGAALAGLAAAGAAVAAANNSSNKKNSTYKANQALAQGLVTAAIVAEASRRPIKKAVMEEYPEGHLLKKGDFIIPPGLFEERWIIVNTRNHEELGYLHSMDISYRTKKGTKETATLQFRKDAMHGKNGLIMFAKKWQRDLSGKIDVRFLAQSCDKGNRYSCYRDGILKKKRGNVSRAKASFSKGCEQKDIPSCFELAEIALEYASSNISKAKKTISTLCGHLYKYKKKHKRGCDQAFMAYLQYERGNTAKAMSLANNSCSKGNTIGCTYLGGYLYIENKNSQAKKIWAKTCDGRQPYYSHSCDLLKIREGYRWSKVNKIKMVFQYRRFCPYEGEKNRYACKMIDRLTDKSKRLPANKR